MMNVLCEKRCDMFAYCQNRHDDIVPVNFDEIFQVLYKRYKYPIYNFFYSKTKFNQSTAEDLTQEAFIKVYRNLNKINYCNITAWLYIVANNTFIDYQRKNQRTPLPNNIIDLESIYSHTIPEDTPCHNLLRNDFKKKFCTIFKSLPPKYCTAIYLHEYENKTYQEAARIMNLSTAAYCRFSN